MKFFMKPNFETMSKAELRAYVLEHRDDQEAFYQLIDRLRSESKDRVWNPFPQSLDEVNQISELIQQQIEKSNQQESP